MLQVIVIVWAATWAALATEERQLSRGDLAEERPKTPEECPDCVFEKIPCPERSCAHTVLSWFQFNFVYGAGECWEMMVAAENSMQIDIDIYCSLPVSQTFLFCENMAEYGFEGVSLFEGCDIAGNNFVQESCAWHCKGRRPFARCVVDFDHSNTHGIQAELDSCWSSQRCSADGTASLEVVCQPEPRDPSTVELHKQLADALDAHNETKIALARTESEKRSSVEETAKHRAAALKLSRLIEELNATNLATASALNLTSEDLRRMEIVLAEARVQLEEHRTSKNETMQQLKRNDHARLNMREEVTRHQQLYDDERSAHDKTKDDAEDTKSWLYILLAALAATLLGLCLAVFCVVRYRWQWLVALKSVSQSISEDNTVYVIGRPAQADGTMSGGVTDGSAKSKSGQVAGKIP